MNRRTLALTTLLLLALPLAGCRTAPVYNVHAAPITRGALGEEQVKHAIMRAGAELGWRMHAVAPGQLLGRLVLRSHVAEVDVYYDTESYSISYRDSHNLDYDGVDIHSNYNGWIKNLDRAINEQIHKL